MNPLQLLNEICKYIIGLFIGVVSTIFLSWYLFGGIIVKSLLGFDSIIRYLKENTKSIMDKL